MDSNLKLREEMFENFNKEYKTLQKWFPIEIKYAIESSIVQNFRLSVYNTKLWTTRKMKFFVWVALKVFSAKTLYLNKI